MPSSSSLARALYLYNLDIDRLLVEKERDEFNGTLDFDPEYVQVYCDDIWIMPVAKHQDNYVHGLMLEGPLETNDVSGKQASFRRIGACW